MGTGDTEVVPDAACVQCVSTDQRTNKGSMAVRTDQAAGFRPPVMETEPFPELVIRILACVHGIEESSVNQAEAEPADFQFILQGEGIQPRKPFLADLPDKERVVIRLLPQDTIPVSGNPVGTMRPGPVAGQIAVRAFSDGVPQKPDVIRLNPVQLLFHSLCGNHIAVKICQQYDFHYLIIPSCSGMGISVFCRE